MALIQNARSAERGSIEKIMSSKCSLYIQYKDALSGHKHDPLEIVSFFRASDALCQNECGQTVGMELLSRGLYGPLSDRLNAVICHLIHVIPIKSFFTLQDNHQKSFVLYLLENLELTDETIDIFASKILSSKKQKKNLLSLLEMQASQFNERTVHCLRSKIALSK
jgi:hypothetical protein